MLIWNAGTEEIFVEIELPDLCISVSFNTDGSKFASTCKDKMIRIFNARTGEVLSVSNRLLNTKMSWNDFLFVIYGIPLMRVHLLSLRGRGWWPSS